MIRKAMLAESTKLKRCEADRSTCIRRDAEISEIANTVVDQAVVRTRFLPDHLEKFGEPTCRRLQKKKKVWKNGHDFEDRSLNGFGADVLGAAQ
jgi:hypothetical protein